jgi:hypothetical protein
MQKEDNKTLVCISHYQFQKGCGMQSVWILFWDCLEIKRGVIPYLLWWKDFKKWHISYHARKQMILHTSQICFSEKW